MLFLARVDRHIHLPRVFAYNLAFVNIFLRPHKQTPAFFQRYRRERRKTPVSMETRVPVVRVVMSPA